MAMTAHTYAELCTVKASNLVNIPAGLEMTTAAALPLVTLTGDNLIRLGAKVSTRSDRSHHWCFQVLLVAQGGLRGITDRCSDHCWRSRKRLDEARQLPGVSEAVAIDDDAEIDKLDPVDCVADTVGGKLANKLLARAKPGGTFGCFPNRDLQDAALYPTIRITIVFAGSRSERTLHFTETILHYAEAVRDGKLTIPINRIMPLADAAEAQAIAEKGGSAKIILTI